MQTRKEQKTEALFIAFLWLFDLMIWFRMLFDLFAVDMILLAFEMLKVLS